MIHRNKQNNVILNTWYLNINLSTIDFYKKQYFTYLASFFGWRLHQNIIIQKPFLPAVRYGFLSIEITNPLFLFTPELFQLLELSAPVLYRTLLLQENLASNTGRNADGFAVGHTSVCVNFFFEIWFEKFERVEDWRRRDADIYWVAYHLSVWGNRCYLLLESNVNHVTGS